MNSQKLLWFTASATILLLLMQPVAATTLRDVFGAFVNSTRPNPDMYYDFDGNGVVNFGDVVYALQLLVGIGRDRIACSSDTDCGGTVQSDPFCDGSNIMFSVIENTCLDPGKPKSKCDLNSTTFLQEACAYGCSAGSCLNQPPIPDAGADQTVSEGEEVTLDASASSDPDGTIVAYEWKEGLTVLSTEMTFGQVFSVGMHTITLTVTDDEGATGTDTVDIDVSPLGLLTAKKLWEYSQPSSYACALLNDNSVKCWGVNNYGQLGDGTTTNSSTPVSVSGISNAKAIALGTYHACALLGDNSVKCWGFNSYGQLGDGTTTNRSTPVSVSGISNVKTIAAGREHTCALLNDNSVKCWGWNEFGMLGDGTFTDSLTPVSVSGIGNVKAIDSGYFHSCAILSDDTIKCWGNNVSGQIGDRTTTNRNTPVSVIGISNARIVEVGSHFTCTLLNNDTIKCWGANPNGELGNGTLTFRSLIPVSVIEISNIAHLDVGYSHSCALLTDNSIKCWGLNSSGGIGDGTTERWKPTPVSVVGINNANAIAVGRSFSCALLSDNTIKCWGYNYYGGLGDGTTTSRYSPVQVVS